jgi:Conjugal transfer protein TraD
MRKPRDFDAALKTLTDKTRALQESKRRQLGELIVATGADALDMDLLAGGLLAMVETNDLTQKEIWHKRGEVFFRGTAQLSARKFRNDTQSAPAGESSETPARSPAHET